MTYKTWEQMTELERLETKLFLLQMKDMWSRKDFQEAVELMEQIKKIKEETK